MPANDVKGRGEAVSQFRRNLGLGETDFAAKIGVARETLRKIERSAFIRRDKAEAVIATARKVWGSSIAFDAWFEDTKDRQQVFTTDYSSLSVEGVVTPDIIILENFLPYDGVSRFSKDVQLRCRLVGKKNLEIPPYLQQAKEQALALRKVRSSKQHFSDDPTFSFQEISTKRSGELKNKRTYSCVVHLEGGSFYDYYWPHLCLDETIKVGDQTLPLRTVLENELGKPLRLPDFDVDTMSNFPFGVSRVGTNTVAISSDHFVIVQERSSRVAIANAGYHVSVPEGMFAPRDVEKQGSTKPCVFATSMNGMEKELGLIRGEDFLAKDLRCVGVLFYVQRLEPIFVFFIHLKVPSEVVLQRWRARAEDAAESSKIRCIRWTEENAKQLAQGWLVLDDGTKLVAASNHARGSFSFVAKRSFGFPD